MHWVLCDSFGRVDQLKSSKAVPICDLPGATWRGRRSAGKAVGGVRDGFGEQLEQ